MAVSRTVHLTPKQPRPTTRNGDDPGLIGPPLNPGAPAGTAAYPEEWDRNISFDQGRYRCASRAKLEPGRLMTGQDRKVNKNG